MVISTKLLQSQTKARRASGHERAALRDAGDLPHARSGARLVRGRNRREVRRWFMIRSKTRVVKRIAARLPASDSGGAKFCAGEAVTNT